MTCFPQLNSSKPYVMPTIWVTLPTATRDARTRHKVHPIRTAPVRSPLSLVLQGRSAIYVTNSAGLVEIFGFDLGENSQNVNQVVRGAACCLCSSALHALAKSVSEFQEKAFVARIAELRLHPHPDGTSRFENTVFHLLVPDRQRLLLFAEHSLEEGFNQ
jgi:hypothetical protein